MREAMILDEMTYALTNALCDGVELLLLGAAEKPELRLVYVFLPFFIFLFFFGLVHFIRI